MGCSAGYTVIIPLIPGYGYATGGGQSYRTADCQAWYRDVVQHFEQPKSTHQTVSVTGLCIGAVLALRLAIDRGDQIAALSLLSTTLEYDG